MIKPELVNARVDELQGEIDKIKTDLEDLKRELPSDNSPLADKIEKVDGLTRQLIILKAGQAELINIISLSGN